MGYDPRTAWTKVFSEQRMAYPSEYVIRMFLGRYPDHSFDKDAYASSNVLDVGCGDGRNLAMLARSGFRPEACYGTEIDDAIVQRIRANLEPIGIPAENIRPGLNHQLPFDEEWFDYLLSWNQCYYMQDHDFEDYVSEFARVTRPGGTIVFSIPKSSCFIYRGCRDMGDGYCVITDDYFDGMRNGERMRRFGSTPEIEEAFGPAFDNFRFGSIHDDCFGLDYHWWIGTARRS